MIQTLQIYREKARRQQEKTRRKEEEKKRQFPKRMEVHVWSPYSTLIRSRGFVIVPALFSVLDTRRGSIERLGLN